MKTRLRVRTETQTQYNEENEESPEQETKSSKRNSPKKKKKNKTDDKVYYADDGTAFHPCKNCSKAFSSKTSLTQHSEECRKDFNTEANMCMVYTDNTLQNINNLNDEMKGIVIENINKILKESKVEVILGDNGNPILVLPKTKLHPMLHITSRNIDHSTVDITTTVMSGSKKSKLSHTIPNLEEILDYNFGKTVEGQENDKLTTSGNFEITIPEALQAFKEKALPTKPISVQDMLSEEEVDVEIQPVETATVEDSKVAMDTIVLEDIDIHICKQCGAVFHSLSDLLNHDKYEHRKVKKRFSAEELEKFNEQYQKSNKNECVICGKKIANRHVWQRHLQTHSFSHKHECRICKRKFTRADHRNRHESRHVTSAEFSAITDDDQKKCQILNKAF